MENNSNPESVVTLAARQLFNVYNETGPTPWKTFDGRDVPRWEGLNDAVRQKWEAVAILALESKLTLTHPEF